MSPEYSLGRNSELSDNTAREMARFYAEVFAAPPWNEVWKCGQCGRFYDQNYSQSESSPCCLYPLGEAYPEGETKEYIREDLEKPGYRAKLFYDNESKLVAFAWGYQTAGIENLAREKWPQSEETGMNVKAAVLSRGGIGPLFYISEVGVAEACRGNGLGYNLTKSLLDLAKEAGIPTIFRTNYASPMMRIAQRLEMDQIMGPKIVVSGRQIITTGEIIGFKDGVNPDRTLFIKFPR